MSDLSVGGPMDDGWKGNAGTRCVAHRKNGDRCKRQARRGAAVCDSHGGKAPQVRAKAQQRLAEAADNMARQLLKMATDEKVSDAVKLAAIRDALDRGGVSTKTSVEFSAKAPEPWEEMVGDITGLTTMSRAESRAARDIFEPPALEPRPGEPEPLDAEVVYERPTGPPPWAEGASAEPGQGSGPDGPRNAWTTWEEGQADIERHNNARNARGVRIREIGM